MFAGTVDSTGAFVSAGDVLGVAVAILTHEDISSGKSPGLYPGLGVEGQGMLQ